MKFYVIWDTRDREYVTTNAGYSKKNTKNIRCYTDEGTAKAARTLLRVYENSEWPWGNPLTKKQKQERFEIHEYETTNDFRICTNS